MIGRTLNKLHHLLIFKHQNHTNAEAKEDHERNHKKKKKRLLQSEHSASERLQNVYQQAKRFVH